MPRPAPRTQQPATERRRIGQILLDQVEAGKVAMQAGLQYNNRSLEVDSNVWM